MREVRGAESTGFTRNAIAAYYLDPLTPPKNVAYALVRAVSRLVSMLGYLTPALTRRG
jgi:hypothetical protein